MDTTTRNTLLQTLRDRFAQHPARHHGIDWEAVEAKLVASPAKLKTLQQMESTGGEPDVIARDLTTGEFVYCDCAAESPVGRRSLCYDRAALDARKANKPEGNAMEMAASMGIEVLTEAQYRELQDLGVFDRKTSSWVATPPEIRALGGALFCDHRFGRVFTYHNGVESYYAARGFRGLVRV